MPNVYTWDDPDIKVKVYPAPLEKPKTPPEFSPVMLGKEADIDEVTVVAEQHRHDEMVKWVDSGGDPWYNMSVRDEMEATHYSLDDDTPMASNSLASKAKIAAAAAVRRQEILKSKHMEHKKKLARQAFLLATTETPQQVSGRVVTKNCRSEISRSGGAKKPEGATRFTQGGTGLDPYFAGERLRLVRAALNAFLELKMGRSAKRRAKREQEHKDLLGTSTSTSTSTRTSTGPGEGDVAVAATVNKPSISTPTRSMNGSKEGYTTPAKAPAPGSNSKSISSALSPSGLSVGWASPFPADPKSKEVKEQPQQPQQPPQTTTTAVPFTGYFSFTPPASPRDPKQALNPEGRPESAAGEDEDAKVRLPLSPKGGKAGSSKRGRGKGGPGCSVVPMEIPKGPTEEEIAAEETAKATKISEKKKKEQEKIPDIAAVAHETAKRKKKNELLAKRREKEVRKSIPNRSNPSRLFFAHFFFCLLIFLLIFLFN
jgi:hypothetical protein